MRPVLVIRESCSFACRGPNLLSESGIIDLNFKSGVPVYLQIVDQVKYLAAAGALRDGDPLPSIRELAQQLRVNRNTIAICLTAIVVAVVIALRPVQAQDTALDPVSIASSPSAFGGTILYRLWSDGTVDRWLIRSPQNAHYKRGWVAIDG